MVALAVAVAVAVAVAAVAAAVAVAVAAVAVVAMVTKAVAATAVELSSQQCRLAWVLLLTSLPASAWPPVDLAPCRRPGLPVVDLASLYAERPP